jgi:uncharacterized protein
MRDLGLTQLSLDQFEAMRLCDVENLDQDEAGHRMGVSRGTIQRLLYSGRRQVIEGIMNMNALIINLQESETEDVSMYPHAGKCRCRRQNE